MIHPRRLNVKVSNNFLLDTERLYGLAMLRKTVRGNKPLLNEPSPVGKVAFAKRYAKQMTDEESKTFALFAVQTKITADSPHHRALFPVRGASRGEKPKHAVTARATKASLSRLRENEGGGPS